MTELPNTFISDALPPHFRTSNLIFPICTPRISAPCPQILIEQRAGYGVGPEPKHGTSERVSGTRSHKIVTFHSNARNLRSVAESLPWHRFLFFSERKMDQNHQLDISGLKLKPVKPEGITDAALASALDEWTAIVGASNVSRDEASGLLQYYDPWSLTSPEQHVPSAALRPTSVEHIQKILSVANNYSIPLWTVSRGRNLG